MIKPLNKPDSPKIIANQPKNLNKPTIVKGSQSQANRPNQNLNNQPSQDLNQDKKPIRNKTIPPIKSPAKRPIQLIEKPKNFTNNLKSNESRKNIYNSADKRQQLNKSDQNTNNQKTRNFNNRKNTPELVGAPIRREDPKIKPNKQNISYKQTNPNRSGGPKRPSMPNRPGLRNKSSDQGRPGSFNRQFNPNRAGSPGGNFRQGGSFKQGDFKRPSSKFNGQKPPGIRKPVSPNELLQLQKNNNSEKDQPGINKKEKQTIESPKQKVKAPNSRPNTPPNSKKPPHRNFTNSSKKNREERLG